MRQLLSFIALFSVSGPLFAQDSAPARGQSLQQMLVMIAIAMLFFYVILWRPEAKKRKIMNEMRAGLKRGDRVIAMGIIGNVEKVDKDTVVIKSAESKLEVLKAVISQVEVKTGKESPGVKDPDA